LATPCPLPQDCPKVDPLLRPLANLDLPEDLCDNRGLPTGKCSNVFGKNQTCDPYLTGQIVEDMAADPKRNIIYRYPQALRGINEGMKNLFSNVVVLDEAGSQHQVPIFWASRERAVEFLVQENIREKSTVTDHVTLPLMSIMATGFSMNMDRYTYHWNQNFIRSKTGMLNYGQEERPYDTVYGVPRGIPVDINYQLNVWTYFLEDMYQILEQVILRFSPIAYISTQGNRWTTIVKLDSMDNNVDTEPGTQPRIVRMQFGFTAEHYIPQPIGRYKTVLQERIDYVNSTNPLNVTEVKKTFIDPE
jgi:hypothetical protein